MSVLESTATQFIKGSAVLKTMVNFCRYFQRQDHVFKIVNNMLIIELLNVIEC